ncbi:MAG: fimbrial protein [Azovibrio sp.]
MTLKTRLFVFFIAACPALAVAANELQFQGNITVSTCNVLVNGEASPIVRLPTIPAIQLEDMNSAAGETSFNITLSSCPISSNLVEIKTLFVASNVTPFGDLRNTGTAGNVDLTLSATSRGYPIDLNGGWTSPSGMGIRLPANSSSTSKDYFVRYHSTLGNTTPGTVRGSVQYAILYP